MLPYIYIGAFLRSREHNGKSRNYLARIITTPSNKCYVKCGGVIKAAIYRDDMKNVVEPSCVANRARIIYLTTPIAGKARDDGDF